MLVAHINTAISGFFNYHFTQQDLAVLGELDTTSTVYQPVVWWVSMCIYVCVCGERALLPSNVSLSLDTYILMVPLGPKLDLSTSCKPMAAVMLSWRAWPRRATSELGLIIFRAEEDLVCWIQSVQSVIWHVKLLVCRQRKIRNLHLSINQVLLFSRKKEKEGCQRGRKKKSEGQRSFFMKKILFHSSKNPTRARGTHTSWWSLYSLCW